MSRASTCYECKPPLICGNKHGKAVHMARDHPEICPVVHLPECEAEAEGLVFCTRDNRKCTQYTILPKPLDLEDMGAMSDEQLATWLDRELLAERSAVRSIIRVLLRGGFQRQAILAAFNETREIQAEGGKRFAPEGRWVSWCGNPGHDDEMETGDDELDADLTPDAPAPGVSSVRCISSATSIFHRQLRMRWLARAIFKENQRAIRRKNLLPHSIKNIIL